MKIVHPRRYWIGTVVAGIGALLTIVSIVQEVVDIGLASFPVRGAAAAALVVVGAGLALSAIDRGEA